MRRSTILDRDNTNTGADSPLEVAPCQPAMTSATLEDFCDRIVALRPILKRIARQRMRNDAWADDAVSETLLAALSKPSAFAGRAKLQSWLVGILKNKMVDQIRRHTRERQFETVDDKFDQETIAEVSDAGSCPSHTGWNDPQECLRQRQFMSQFDQCIKALPSREARAFMLRHWLEEETADICNELSVSTNNLYVILHRARNHLRESLQAQWAPV